jgi:hypothetical protein
MLTHLASACSAQPAPSALQPPGIVPLVLQPALASSRSRTAIAIVTVRVTRVSTASATVPMPVGSSVQAIAGELMTRTRTLPRAAR